MPGVLVSNRRSVDAGPARMIKLQAVNCYRTPLMPLLPSRHYVSEHTQFIRELLEKKPQLEADQRIGRAIWWDKLPSEVEARREMDQSRVAQKAYVYGSG
jgi:hypothetical protein